MVAVVVKSQRAGVWLFVLPNCWFVPTNSAVIFARILELCMVSLFGSGWIVLGGPNFSDKIRSIVVKCRKE